MRNNKNPHNNEKPSRPGRTLKIRRSKPSSAKLVAKQEQTKIRSLAAVNGVRTGRFPTLTAAAKAEGTTVKSIRKTVPAALIKRRPGQPIRVKAGDPYSAKVRILTNNGEVVVKARGSRQRRLAAEHRKVYDLVLGNKLPASALEQFRGRKIGGHELLADYEELRTQAQAGVLDQLKNLYVSPGASA